ncbi:hypothetical protein JNUCC1_02204 [Lentibacillus sp. JNUCC-1]|uniref:hypothetical protein n=1 Tax=Lentibacillus sp. JNUCC-1 TaxID=2654513 RepID=UPI0012E9485D|nr:hypothetical protein [Lentibacillus sp. JNUCC-1]MUV38366.1 hypothetical protein [Lentibacillus sp. JNUCC-1]
MIEASGAHFYGGCALCLVERVVPLIDGGFAPIDCKIRLIENIFARIEYVLHLIEDAFAWIEMFLRWIAFTQKKPEGSRVAGWLPSGFIIEVNLDNS